MEWSVRVKEDSEVSNPQWCDCCREIAIVRQGEEVSFNPTMVRLLLKRLRQVKHKAQMFQSHNGAIAAS